ncbi:hypothetical protein [Chitinimonas koreensis]|uniref:hypothetical protein n=1 Tax=Chitinimonas koreensis TaxID=356302 RepID=UPI00048B8D91|nr:hypothetical protein [Chitinimonas koreensis]QNM97608.1 hypothetical protein H9L41_04725 [Chitinimonas koreensis]
MPSLPLATRALLAAGILQPQLARLGDLTHVLRLYAGLLDDCQQRSQASPRRAIALIVLVHAQLEAVHEALRELHHPLLDLEPPRCAFCGGAAGLRPHS